jgi:glycine cleavage system H protein
MGVEADTVGWLCKIKLSGPQEFETLLNAEAYKAHCEGEA